jgi:citrate synthase
MTTRALGSGLEGVIASSSAISSIEEGVLRYRGYRIEDLARHAGFEEVVGLLWDGDLPSAHELDRLGRELRAAYGLPEMVDRFLRRIPPTGAGNDPMAILIASTSLMALAEPEVEHRSPEASRRKAVRLTAAMGTAVGTLCQVLYNKEPGKPDAGLPIAGNLLLMVRGDMPSPPAMRALDVALVLHADHELNASTFAARVTAATQSDMHSAVISALATLKGPLHGGANRMVIEMLDEIGDVSNVEPWFDRALAQKRRLMGFGHRVYKTGDPRAAILKELGRDLLAEGGDSSHYEIAVRLDELVSERTGLLPNVDFYSAPYYDLLGFPREMFGCLFAVSRIAGWTAHITEQYQDNRLIRPRAEYTGPGPREWLPVEQRS